MQSQTSIAYCLLVFRRHLKNKVDLDATDGEEAIGNLVGRTVKVHYNTPTEDNNIAVKIELMPSKEEKP